MDPSSFWIRATEAHGREEAWDAREEEARHEVARSSGLPPGLRHGDRSGRQWMGDEGGSAGGTHDTDGNGRVARGRRPELLHSRRQSSRARWRRDRSPHQPARQALRPRRPDPGLAHARAHLVRLDPRQEALRGDRSAVRQAGAVAGSLRSGHFGGGSVEGSADPACRADHPEGLSPEHGLLLRLLRGGWEDPDRPHGLPPDARPEAGLPRGARHRLLCGLVGDRRS